MSIPRLLIILYILPRKYVTFSELEKNLDLTSGNLQTHIKKLETENIIKIKMITLLHSLTYYMIQTIKNV